jgi:Tfp pilus assembly protein PilO
MSPSAEEFMKIAFLLLVCLLIIVVIQNIYLNDKLDEIKRYRIFPTKRDAALKATLENIARLLDTTQKEKKGE